MRSDSQEALEVKLELRSTDPRIDMVVRDLAREAEDKYELTCVEHISQHMQYHCRPRNDKTHRICTFDIVLWLTMELPTQKQTN